MVGLGQDRAPQTINAMYQMCGDDPKACNSFEDPNRIVPLKMDALAINDHCLSLMLPPLSFTVLDTRM